MLKAKCGSCGMIKTQFVKKTKEENLISIRQCFLYYQKRDKHFQDIGHCGPGNPLDNGPPTNELDAICMEHNYCYSSNSPKSECEKNILGKLSFQ